MTKEQSDLIKKCFAKGICQSEIPIKEVKELEEELIKALDIEKLEKLEKDASRLAELEILVERMVTNSINMENQLRKIWEKVNNAHYFGDMKPRNFYYLIHEVASIIYPDYEEIGKEFIED